MDNSKIQAFRQLPVANIDPNPQQPRKVFCEDSLNKLSDNISEIGVLQPIVVKMSHIEGRYQLIAGERRLQASKKSGMERVPAVVRDVDSKDMLRMALFENVLRESLNPIEESEAIRELISKYDITQEECGKSLGRSRSAIANALRLLDLPTLIKSDIALGELTAGHGKALCGIKESDKAILASKVIKKKGLNARQAEKLCRDFSNASVRKGASSESEEDADIEYIAERLRSHLRTKVKFSGSGDRGKIEISYFSSNELERLISLIT